jgi:hypothetical protein
MQETDMSAFRHPLVFAAFAAAFAFAADARAEAGPAVIPPKHILPACITLVGSSAGVPARAAGEFVVVLRDLANNPIPFYPVTIDLAYATDLRLCADQLDPSLTLDCAHSRVTAVSDAIGWAFFTLLGGANPGGTRTFGKVGRFYLAGELIGTTAVRTCDLDGWFGVGANDLSSWLADFGSGLPYARTDYDCDGFVGANDLSLWIKAFGDGDQTQSCSVGCP